MTNEQGTTSYDRVQYPAALYATLRPGHLGAIARLHGLDIVDPTKARMLEIAGGDGINMIALAYAYPDGQFDSFDLSARAVERGKALIKAAGITNATVEIGDVIEAAETMTGEYDYIIAHGLYAWVPEPVRAATLKLIGRLLSPKGMAMVSYNALPGGYLRMAIRDMLVHETGSTEPSPESFRLAYQRLQEFTEPRENDEPAPFALRFVAKPMLRKLPGALFHDELGAIFAPQLLTSVVAAAKPHGLAFLGDSTSQHARSGLPGEDLSDDETVHALQRKDFDEVCFFRQTLFLRPDRKPLRRLDPSVFASLYLTASITRGDGRSFTKNDAEFEVDSDALADFLEAASAAAPARTSLAPFADSPDICDDLLSLYEQRLIEFHATPFPGVARAGDRPMASALVRTQIGLGLKTIYTLDHQVLTIEEEGPRAFLSLLDGTHSRAELKELWAQNPHGAAISVDDALEQLAKAGMLLA